MADPKILLADAALKLLAKSNWSDLTLMQVSRAARVEAGILQGVSPNKPALLGLILDWIGGEVAKRYQRDTESEDARDRLLDVTLTWFEALNAHKAAVRALYDGLRRDPFTLVAARTEIIGAAEWLLTLAEADTGPALPVRALALGGVIARAIPVWLEDDAAMTKTMARLDGDLRRATDLFGRLRRRRDDETKRPPRSSAAAEKTARSKKVSTAGTRRRSRARNPARRRN
ncbi:MAG TPA: hypothetical protein VGG69_04715 [Rhizomicrobium sp.]|jgi:hypothetical protein